MSKASDAEAYARYQLEAMGVIANGFAAVLPVIAEMAAKAMREHMQAVMIRAVERAMQDMSEKSIVISDKSRSPVSVIEPWRRTNVKRLEILPTTRGLLQRRTVRSPVQVQDAKKRPHKGRKAGGRKR